MDEPKFTPGPWKAHGTAHQDFVTTNWEDTENQEYICKCGNDNGFENSFLIAAAPDMYTKLVEVNAHLIFYLGTRIPGSELSNFELNAYHLQQEIEQLLAKARGESNE